MRKNLNTLFIVFIALFLSVFIAGCASAPSGGGGSVKGKSEPRPDWVVTPPVNNAYYIGIGTGTNTDDAMARDNAIYRAKSYLAGDILTKISSETKIHDFESSKGETYESYESNILASMEANLQGTEIVDEWESADGVYWVYIRLSIALWEKIQAEEMAALDKRVRDMVEPLVKASNKSITEKLTVLWKGWELVYDSPYAGLVDTEMFGEKGDLFDTIERKIVSYVNSLSLDVPVSNIVTEFGRPIKLSADVSTYLSEKIGKIPLGFYVGDEATDPSITFNTSSDGKYAGEFSLPGLKLGKNTVYARINLAEFGIDQNRMVTKLIVPESSILVDYQQIKIGLDIKNPDAALAGVEGGVKALFSERELPFKIDNASRNEYVMKFELVFEDIPDTGKTGKIRYAWGRCQFSLVKNGKSIFTYETEKSKDGGIGYGQAHERVWKKLLEKIARDDGLYNGMMDSLDLE